MSFIEKFMRHAKSGTLVERAIKKASQFVPGRLYPLPSDAPTGDVYHGGQAENYLKKRTKQDYWHLEQRVVRDLLAELPDGLSVLDVPFGTGRFVPYYLEKRMTVYGLDSSEDMLQVARRVLERDYLKCNLELGDAQRLPYGANSFDLVVCFRFLSHVVSFDQARAILLELNRVARWKALIQLRVRRGDASPVRGPLGAQPMGERLYLAALTRLLEASAFRVTKTVPLENRHTYFRSVFICEKK